MPDQEDPFKKYGGKQVTDTIEDPFKKYGGQSIPEPSKKKIYLGDVGTTAKTGGQVGTYVPQSEEKQTASRIGGNLGGVTEVGITAWNLPHKEDKPTEKVTPQSIENYNKQFEEYTGHKEFSLGSDLPQIKRAIEEKKYLLNRKIEEHEINPVLSGVATGTITPEQLSKLYNKPYGKKIVSGVINEQVPEAGSMALESDVFGNEKKWENISTAINTKNRPLGVEAQGQYFNTLDAEMSNALNGSEIENISVSGGTGGGAANVSRFKLPQIDVNNTKELGELAYRIEQGDSRIIGKYGNEVSKDAILKKINEKIFYINSQKDIDQEITSISDKTKEAITRVNMARERGEGIPIEKFAKEDAVNQHHFELGLNFIKDAKPGTYRNVIRGITERGIISDIDFEQIAKVGQQMYNQQLFRAGATNPEAIGKETDIIYDSYQTKRAEYSAILSEEIKSMGYKNMGKVPQKAIDAAAYNHPELTNKEIINDIKLDEANGGYGITKGGGLNAFFRGFAAPIKSINTTINALTQSPVDNYLESKRLDLGDQQIPDAEGNYRDVLPSERGNMFNQVSEGLGQFFTQVILAKGMGKLIEAPYSAFKGISKTASTIDAVSSGVIPEVGVTAAESSFIAAYPSTFITMAAQTYGSSYTDLLAKTGDPATAKLGAAINTTVQAAIESFIMPDVKIAEKAKGLLEIARKKLAGDIINLVKNGGDKIAAKSIIRSFTENAGKIMGGNLVEENLQQVTDFVTESIFSPSTIKDRDLGKEIWETTKGTTLQMAVATIFGAAGETKANKKFSKDGLHTGAINFNEYRDALGKSLINNEITQQQHDEALGILSLHRNSINNAPKRDANGELISANRQLEYAYQNTVSEINTGLAAEQKDKVQQEPLLKKVEDADKIKRKIFYGEEIKDLPKKEIESSQPKAEETVTTDVKPEGVGGETTIAGSGGVGDVDATAKKIVGESAFDKLKKEGYTIEKGKFDRDAYADFFGVGEGVQADEFANAGLKLVKPKEKIKVFRGVGKNVAEGDNEGISWVAEDKKVAENYSGDGKVEEIEVNKPKNPFPNPTDTIYVKGSEVGNKLRLVRDRLFKEGKLTKEQALEVSKAIDDFVSAAGEESELYSTKTNKKGVSSKYVKALQALGFDGIVQKESYNSGSPFTATKTGNETNTYGIFKPAEQSLKETTIAEPPTNTEAQVEKVAELETKRSEEIKEATKVDVDLPEFSEIDREKSSSKQLRKADRVNRDFERLKEVINCIWGKAV